MDWVRKHMLDLSGVFKKCREDTSLTFAQREKFSQTYVAAKQFSTLPQAGGSSNVTAVIFMGCAACQDGFHNECPGRYDWQHRCLLMQGTIVRE